MASRKRKTIIEEQIPEGEQLETGEVTDFDVTLEAVQDAEALQSVLEQFGVTAESFLKIYKMKGNAGWEFCFRPVENVIDEEFIRKNFGAGDFIARVFIRNAMKKQVPFSIAPLLEEHGNGNGNGNSHQSFLEKMVMALVMKENATPSHAPSLNEITQALANLDGLRQKPESGMESFMKGLEFARNMEAGKSSGDWKSDLIATAKESIPMFANIFMASKQNPTAIQPANASVPATVPTADNASKEHMAMIKSAIEYLKKKCLSGTDPGLIIDWIVNNAEEYQALIHLVMNTPYATFETYDEQLATEPFKQWFTGLFDGLRQAFTADDTVDVDTTGNSRDIGHTGNDGNAGTNAKRKSK